MTNTLRLPHPHNRAAELEVDVDHVSDALAETFRHWAADWARLTTEAPFRATLSRRLLTVAEKAQNLPLDRLADDLRDLASDAELAHKRGRIAAWRSLGAEDQQAAA